MATATDILNSAWQTHQSGNVEAAASVFRRVSRSDPENATAWCYLGIACHDLAKFDEAVEAYRQAIQLQPNFPIAYNNLGNTLRRQGNFDEAVANYHESIRQDPNYINAYKNLGTAFAWKGRVDEAVAAYQHALRLDPNDAESHKNVGVMRLLQGKFTQGWPEYDWRWKTDGIAPPSFDRPKWDGGSLAGKTILLFAEQGLGDTLHFVRYAAVLREQADQVIVQCQAPLVPLLRGCRGIDKLITPAEDPPPFDVYASFLDVAATVVRDERDIAAEVPYLTVGRGLEDYWRDELARLPGLKVGIAWQGNPDHQADHLRSVRLEMFRPLAEIDGVHLVNLQKGFGSEQLPALALPMPVTDFSLRMDESGAFLDTAAVMNNLDVVITTDTSIAHLAGGLAVPTWLLLSSVPDWRWLLDREDSPWYPTLRLFRQQSACDWASVFRRVTAELRARAAKKADAIRTARPETPKHAGRASPSSHNTDPSTIALAGFNQLVRACHGMMLCNNNDMYVGRSLLSYGEFSEGEVNLFRQVIRPGSLVVEAGANLGAHTVPLARVVGGRGRVLAFEPQRVVFQSLCANVALNSLTNVVCRNEGLGRQAGSITVPPLDYARENNFGGLSLGQYKQGELVAVSTIDGLRLRQCHMIKVDVEGMEAEVLRGAQETITRCRPILYVENDRPEQSAELIELIQGFGYKLYWHVPPLFNPNNYFQNSHNVFGSLVSINMLCVHTSVDARIHGLREIESPQSEWQAS